MDSYLGDDLDGDIYGDEQIEELSGLNVTGLFDEYDSPEPNVEELSAEDELASTYGSFGQMKEAFQDNMEESIGRHNQEQEGMMTARDLQLGRISHVSDSVQAGIRGLLSGKFKYEPTSEDDIMPLKIAAAIEEFEEVTGVRAADFAAQMKGSAFAPRGTPFPRHPIDMATTISMLGTTSGEYMDRGAGSKLAGNSLIPERQEKADEDLKKALSFVKDIASVYVHSETVGSSVQEVRTLAVEEAITKRFMDSTMGAYRKDLLPLPNETGVTGIKPTMAGKGSTPMTRLEFGFSDLATGQEKLPFDERSKEYWDNRPNLEKSLFPIGKSPHEYGTVENTKWFFDAAAEQKRKITLYQEKAEFAATVLREQMPTLRDETEGRGRSRGFDANQEEQRELDNARNEAYLLDLSLDGAEQSVVSRELVTKSGKGSQQGGMYGGKEMSESQIFVEGMAAAVGNTASELEAKQVRGSYLEHYNEIDYIEDPDRDLRLIPFKNKSVFNMTDQEAYQYKQLMNPSPEQGTEEWLAQRKGNITGSIAKTLQMGRGSERMAVQLAQERLGTGEKFKGNAFTREGNESEMKAVDSFLSGEGKGLNYEEAFYESKNKGFGASPDGRLFDKATGQSAGLLEIKNFNTKGMKTALADTQVQMQMQMMETGENQTHFYALNKYTGESFYELVGEDLDMQAELLAAGQEAQAIASGLDNRGVYALAEDVKGARKPRKKTQTKGQVEAFTEVEEEEEAMTAFDDRKTFGHTAKKISRSKYSKDDNSSQANVDGEIVNDQDKAKEKDKAKEAITSSPSGLVEKSSGAEAAELRREVLKARADLAKDAAPKTSVGGSGDGDDNDNKARFAYGGGRGRSGRLLNHEMKEGWKIKGEDTKGSSGEGAEEASEALKVFADNVNKASATLGKLAAATMATVDEAMGAVQLGTASGLSTNTARGLSDALIKSGVSETAAGKAITAAGSQVSVYKNEISAAKEFSRVQIAVAASNSKDIQALDVASFHENRKTMNAQDYIANAQSMTSNLSPADRVAALNILKVPQIAPSDATGETLGSAIGDVDEATFRDANQAIKGVTQGFRDIKEGAVEITGDLFGADNVGTAAAVTSIAAPAVGAAVLYAKRKAVTNTAQAVAKTAASTSANIGKNLVNAVKLSPIALAASALPMAVRYGADVEDDGGLADSLLDVADFTATGAAIGSLIVPGVGTAIGAGVGATVGVGNELYEWATAPDDVFPSSDIGQMKGTNIEQNSNKVTNVDVNVEVSPDLVRTTTEVDGDLDIDEESGLGTGG